MVALLPAAYLSRCLHTQALKGVRWGKYPPGMEQVTLRANVQGGADMEVERVSTPNQPYKPVGMLKVSAPNNYLDPDLVPQTSTTSTLSMGKVLRVLYLNPKIIKPLEP